MIAFALVALALVQAVPAPLPPSAPSPPPVAAPLPPPDPVATLAQGRWKAMNTPELAAMLLPPNLAARMVTHRVIAPVTADGPPIAVVFYRRPNQAPDGFCDRKLYYAPVSESDRTVRETSETRFGACPTSPGGEFAHLQPDTRGAEAKGALRWLAEASVAARGGEPLAFDVDCVARARPNLCKRGARAALAALPAENTFIIGGLFNCKPWDMHFTVRQDELAPGIVSGPVWDARLVRLKGKRPRLKLRWIYPPPA